MQKAAKRLAFVAGLGTALLAGEALRADGFRNPPDGASALSRNGGKYTFGSDATAVAHNPATLTDLKAPELLITDTLIYHEKEFTDPAGRSWTTDEPWISLPGVYGAWPLHEGRCTAGLGVNVPFGQGTEWPKDSTPGQAGPYEAEMMVLNFNPSAAADLGHGLSVGAGADLYWSQVTLKQQVFADNDLVADGDSEIEAEGGAVGWNAGLLWAINPVHRLGATYRSAFDIDYEGDLSVNGAMSLDADVDTTLQFPAVVGLGYGVKLSETVRAGIDVEWAQNSRFERLELNVDTSDPALMAALGASPQLQQVLQMMPSSIPQNWEDTWTYGAGLEWFCSPGWTVRGGASFVESPMQDETLLPFMAEGDQTMLATGVAYARNAHRLDLAYGYSIFDDRKIDDNQNPAYNGQYEFLSHLVAVSYAYRF